MSSSNPFRRKTNADPQSSIPANPAGTGLTQPLSINTGTKTLKSVRIASPPDTAISPASYPSSPEFARLTPSPQQTIVPYPFNAIPHAQANDPLGPSDSSGDEDDGVVSEALNNTRLNIASTRVPSAEASNHLGNAVQNTLSKFASRPRDGSATATQSAAEAPKQDSRRQTMDVDAFTRLLLTGGNTQGTSGPSNVTSTGPPNTLSESSSTADSASISRQSIFEPMPPIAAESPRTSHELDEAESVVARRAVVSSEAPGGVKKTPSKPPPPAPRPRHGKPIKQPQLPPPGATRQPPHIPPASSTSPVPRSPESDLNKPLPPPPASDSSRRSSITSIMGIDLSTQIKQPPTPPLSRRRSQGPSKPPLSRSSASLQSLSGISPSLSSSSSIPNATKPPRPPPSRRTSQRLSPATNSPSLPYTSEETDPIDLSKPIMFQLSRTTSTATRASILSAENAAPQPPPPRRHRGSSNASQRPSLGATSTAAITESAHPSIEGQRPEFNSTRKSSAGSSRDILKDLASLQAEVDALRREGFRD
jgi:hypothetical protein